MRPGVRPYWACEAYQITPGSDNLKILATTAQIRHRGDTLQGPSLTVRISSPAADVIRVRVSHFDGVVDRGPHFEIEDSHPSVQVISDDAIASLTSGALSIKVDRKNWEMAFVAEGRVITRSPGRALALMEVEGKGNFIHEQLMLGVGENVYGLGERFTAFVKNGQVVDIWNEDGGTNSEQAYKNVPFYLTNRGYGVFVNHPGKVSFEVASERSSRVGFSVPGESLEYFVIYGPTPKEILRKYTALTGRPALPPVWSFGLWLSTSFTTNYDEETVTSFIQGMEDRDLPLHVFHFDCFWMRAFHWTDLVWDPEVFPDPPAMLKRLKDRGLKICAWINPYIAQESRLFEEGVAGGFLVKRPNGDVWQWDKWQPGMALVDFTNPDACAWFQARLEELLDAGVDALKTDFGERIPTDVVYHDGSDPVGMHNFYTQLYNHCVFELLERKRGVGEAVLFARSATVGGQKFPVHWGGDCWSDFEAMAESLRGGLSLGLSGFGFWSHDIGGFEGLPPAALYKRWVAFGLLSSHSRLHGSGSYRVPWLYDDEACDTLRFFTKLKCRLMPYLFGKAVEAHEKGLAMMRPMLVEFPFDPTCDNLDRQYMLGDSLLVAPVFSFGDEVQFYVPEGRWTSLIDGHVLEGPAWHTESHGFLSVPLMVRPNTLLATGVQDFRPDYDLTRDLTISVYELEDGATATCTIVDAVGNHKAEVQATRTGTLIRISTSAVLENWTVRLVGVTAIAGATGATIDKSGSDISLSANPRQLNLEVELLAV